MANPTPLPQAVGAAAVPATPPTLTQRLQQKCSDWGTYWRAPDAHGVVLTQDQALELLRDALGVEVEFASPSPASTSAPAEPTQARKCFYCLRDMIAGSECTSKAQSECGGGMKGAPDAAPVGEPNYKEWAETWHTTAMRLATIAGGNCAADPAEMIRSVQQALGVAADERTRAAPDERAAFESWLWFSGERTITEEYGDPRTSAAWDAWQARAKLASPSGERPSAQPIRATGTEAVQQQLYVTCHQCENCQHIGINDEHLTESACNRGACGWHGPSPDEDRCPGCGETGTMSSACPECGCHYVLLADDHITALTGAAAGAAGPWQPIATAPRGSGKNGPALTTDPDYVAPPRLLLATAEGVMVGYYDWYYHPGYGVGAEPGESVWRDHDGGRTYGVTHWMPLPTPPDAAGAAQPEETS